MNRDLEFEAWAREYGIDLLAPYGRYQSSTAYIALDAWNAAKAKYQPSTASVLDDTSIRKLKESFADFCFETADGSNCPTYEDVQTKLLGMHSDLWDEIKNENS